MTPEETRAINNAVFDELARPGDPIKVLQTKIEINRFMAERCREDGSPGMGRLFDALADYDDAKLQKLLAKQNVKPT